MDQAPGPELPLQAAIACMKGIEISVAAAKIDGRTLVVPIDDGGRKKKIIEVLHVLIMGFHCPQAGGPDSFLAFCPKFPDQPAGTGIQRIIITVITAEIDGIVEDQRRGMDRPTRGELPFHRTTLRIDGIQVFVLTADIGRALPDSRGRKDLAACPEFPVQAAEAGCLLRITSIRRIRLRQYGGK